jgi:uncharacterized membrane protein YesL
MSEAEVGLLFNEHVDSFVTILFGYFSITSAFLVASYLAARKIPHLLANVTIVLYSVMAVSLIAYAQRHGAVCRGLQLEMKKLGVTWQVVATEPTWLFPLMTNTMVLSMFGIFIASVAYFFYARYFETPK